MFSPPPPRYPVVWQQRGVEEDTLVPNTDLPSWAQLAFASNEKVKNLNRVQSQLCDCALFSGENLLLCAPTGAGKTNVALLAMLHVRGNDVSRIAFVLLLGGALSALPSTRRRACVCCCL